MEFCRVGNANVIHLVLPTSEDMWTWTECGLMVSTDSFLHVTSISGKLCRNCQRRYPEYTAELLLSERSSHA